MAGSRRLSARFVVLVAASVLVFQGLSQDMSVVRAADPTGSAAPSASPDLSPAPDPGSAATPSRLAAPAQLVAATNDQWKTLELSGGTTNPEPSGWQSVGFDDAAWSAAYIPTDPYPTWVDIPDADWLSSTGRATGHLTSEIWIARYEFELAGAPEGDGTLTWNVDNYASIWVNGQQIVTTAGNWTNVFTTTVPVALLQVGTKLPATSPRRRRPTARSRRSPTIRRASS